MTFFFPNVLLLGKSESRTANVTTSLSHAGIHDNRKMALRLVLYLTRATQLALLHPLPSVLPVVVPAFLLAP